MSRCVLGMDVSKKDISLALLKDNRFFEKIIPNSLAGFKEILNFLQKHNALKAECFLESTGSYSEAVADFLFDNEFVVKVVNPFKIKSFARSRLSRIKTDKKDAQLIAEYGTISANDLNYQKPSTAVRSIRSLYGTYLAQTKISSQCKNHIEHATNELNKNVWTETLCEFELRRKKIVNQIIDLINTDKKLKTQFENLQSIDGIAEISSIAILAEVQSVDKFVNARQLAAYCGLTPRICESGTSVHKKPRISKFGNSFLRNALYFPAIVAIQRCEQFHRYSQKLLSRGKAKKQIIVAVMKKILLAAFAILKYDCKFDPDLIFKTH
ncbi:MAG: IS110 family transposase [Alphaproteobacteria bacterium]|nr:IS110 family transposase [Alphaproteobacteria bacterium]